jgi:hypothetical protein
MSDAFISYSREDGRQFVDRLHGALRAQGKDVWVDRRIPGGAEWEAEIRENIRHSDAFVFVISPGAFNPQGYCLRELDHAIELGKRILPLQYRPVDAESLPEAIKTHNWIPSEGGFEDSFDEHLGKLIEAIETDLDWVRGHTHWGEQAAAWAENGRDKSFLLRGAELRHAEQWLSDQEGKEPPPTPLHSEYVLGSRAGATRRQRVLIGGVSIGLVVAAALAIFAFVQRNHAIQERRAADSANGFVTGLLESKEVRWTVHELLHGRLACPSGFMTHRFEQAYGGRGCRRRLERRFPARLSINPSSPEINFSRGVAKLSVTSPSGDAYRFRLLGQGHPDPLYRHWAIDSVEHVNPLPGGG